MTVMSNEEIEEQTEKMLIDGNVLDAYYFLCEVKEANPWDNSISNILAFVCVCNSYWDEAKQLLNAPGYVSYDEYAYLSRAVVCLQVGDTNTSEDILSEIIERNKSYHKHLNNIFAKLYCLSLSKAACHFGKILKQKHLLNIGQDDQLLREIMTLERYYEYIDDLKKEHNGIPGFTETIRNAICFGSQLLSEEVVYFEIKEALIAIHDSYPSRKDVLGMLCFLSSILNDKRETEFFINKARNMENETYYQLAKANYALNTYMFGSAYIYLKDIITANKSNKDLLPNLYGDLKFFDRLDTFLFYFGKLLYKEGVFDSYDPTGDDNMEYFSIGDHIEAVYLYTYPDEYLYETIYLFADLNPDKEQQSLRFIRKYILFIYPWVPKLLAKIKQKDSKIFKLTIKHIQTELKNLRLLHKTHKTFEKETIKELEKVIKNDCLK